MQITINVPDNLPQAIIQQHIAELEDKLKQQANCLTHTANNKTKKQQAIIQIAKKCASLPTIDHRTADEILGYEKSAMGLWGDE